MSKVRKLAAFGSMITICLAAYADCNDIKKHCQREFDLDNAACNKQPRDSQPNCFARSHERFISCLQGCK